MQDELFDRDFQLARAHFLHGLRRLLVSLRAVGRAHQRVFWSAPWRTPSLRDAKRSLPL
ncbi:MULTISPECIES: hypothetical protein [Sphingomonas]|uniref:hypothetical protein n=1 Tax=Sphingomonas TaxID=13687 RepID=UPI0013B386F7|nr:MULTISPECIES: hypothetical protein [Sphingomonas]